MKIKKIFLLLKLIGVALKNNIIAKFKVSNNQLVILRLDVIGDYILFRNFFEKLKMSKKYGHYNITLVGNIVWKDLAEKYDSNYVDQFIWVDLTLISNQSYYKDLRKKLASTSYDVLINPHFSRFWLCEELSMALVAKKKILAYGNLERIRRLQSFLSVLYYDEVIRYPAEITFEFLRNKYFIEQILNEKIDISKPDITVLPLNSQDFDARNSVIIFPGASDPKRSWPIDNYKKLIDEILTSTNANIIIAGGKSEFLIGEELLEYFRSDRVKNLTGKTSLVELVNLISDANLLISNETSAVHIAAAVNTSVICLLGGGHFGRFVPYLSDEDCDKLPVAAFYKMPCFNCNWQCIYKVNDDEYYPCLEKIEVEKVISFAKKYWNTQQANGIC